MTHFMSGEGAVLYLHYAFCFVLGLVFLITHSVYIQFLLISEWDLGLLQGLGWSSF